MLAIPGEQWHQGSFGFVHLRGFAGFAVVVFRPSSWTSSSEPSCSQELCATGCPAGSLTARLRSYGFEHMLTLANMERN